MKSPVRLKLSIAACTLLAFTAGLRGQATTPTVSTVYSFTGMGTNGANPNGLIQGSDGNFYGTTAHGGGGSNDGTVFRLTPAGGYTALHSFTGGISDGANPNAGVIEGSDGNFYGTTLYGGVNNAGAVFQVTPAGVYTILHIFLGGVSDGANPNASVVEGSDGNFYGTTYSGGSGGDGTVFQITPAGVYTILHSFTGSGTDGAEPAADLVQGSDGNFYSTTSGGGSAGEGTVFRITSAGGYATLYSFGSGADATPGFLPGAGLVQGRDGNFYGTTSNGGSDVQGGTVFQITPAGVLTTLHAFSGFETDGALPAGGLVEGSDGNFYGTTEMGGGTHTNVGTIYRITSAGEYTALYSFTGTGNDGKNPGAGLILGSDGNFYGTALNGGSGGDGTVYQLALHPAFFTGEVAVGNGVEYLSFPNSNFFGYYSFLSDPNYLYHFDLGYEYVFDANDGKSGVYFYDFESQDFFYTSPTFPFPYLYDFNLNSVVYYYPDPNNAGHYNTDGVRYFYDFATGKIISK